ncbi:MAG: hypothetical protein K2K00_03930, partial [Muribaculaceae bacterium]|nr:hypothetical protein [Muribaculaceae bacterium]
IELILNKLMRKISTVPILILSAVTLVITCNCANKNTQNSSTKNYTDSLSQYRDTIVGKFNGTDIDTLICEPIGDMIDNDFFGKFYTEWRVYTVKGTVEELKIGNTFGINFVEEGDLDGNKTEEWGYIPRWNSSLTVYELFTVVDGRWELMVEPILIWRDLLETSFSESDIAQPSDKNGFIKIKKSYTVGEECCWVFKDTITPISPRDYTYKLVEW